MAHREVGVRPDFTLAFKGLPDPSHPQYQNDLALQRLRALKDNIFWTVVDPSMLKSFGTKLTLYDRLVPLEAGDLVIAKHASFKLNECLYRGEYVQVPKTSPWASVLSVEGNELSSKAVEVWSVDPDIPVEGYHMIAIGEQEDEYSELLVSVGLIITEELKDLEAQFVRYHYEDTK